MNKKNITITLSFFAIAALVLLAGWFITNDNLPADARKAIKTDAVKNEGATRVVAYITHPVLSGPAIDRINASQLDELAGSTWVQMAGSTSKWLKSSDIWPIAESGACNKHTAATSWKAK